MWDDEHEGYLFEDEYLEEFYEWYEAHDMVTYSFHYDADSDNQILGFTITDINPLSSEFDKWLEDVKEKAQKFYELTGVEAQLIGMQNVW